MREFKTKHGTTPYAIIEELLTRIYKEKKNTSCTKKKEEGGVQNFIVIIGYKRLLQCCSCYFHKWWNNLFNGFGF